MKRREFITLLSGAVAARPLAARAQQPAKLPTIGLLGANSASQQSEWTAAFLQRLRELGWIEGRTVSIEVRWAEGSNERAAEIAAELVRLRVDIIVTSGTPIVLRRKAEAAARTLGVDLFAAPGCLLIQQHSLAQLDRLQLAERESPSKSFHLEAAPHI
jgi:hypothetical protein